MYSAPSHYLWCLGFLWLPWGAPLNYLALGATGTHIPGFHGTVTIERIILGRLPLQGTAQTED